MRGDTTKSLSLSELLYKSLYAISAFAYSWQSTQTAIDNRKSLLRSRRQENLLLSITDQSLPGYRVFQDTFPAGRQVSG